MSEKTTIEIEAQQCAVIFSNDEPPQVYFPDIEGQDPDAEATPAMLQVIAVMYLAMHPERLHQIIEEATEHMRQSQIVLPNQP
jgi:hypothetical protein